MTDYRYRVEMKFGQDQREVDADGWTEDDGWMIFYRKPPQGGIIECWRVHTDCVIAVETVRQP